MKKLSLKLCDKILISVEIFTIIVFIAVLTSFITSIFVNNHIDGVAKEIRVTERQTPTRNIEYEHYCDSIWIADKDYYLDVLTETDEYQEYIRQNGQWWNN